MGPMLGTKNMPIIVTLCPTESVTVVSDSAYFSSYSPSGMVRLIDPKYSQIPVRAVRTNQPAATVGPHRTHLSGSW